MHLFILFWKYVYPLAYVFHGGATRIFHCLAHFLAHRGYFITICWLIELQISLTSIFSTPTPPPWPRTTTEEKRTRQVPDSSPVDHASWSPRSMETLKTGGSQRPCYCLEVLHLAITLSSPQALFTAPGLCYPEQIAPLPTQMASFHLLHIRIWGRRGGWELSPEAFCHPSEIFLKPQ